MTEQQRSRLKEFVTEALENGDTEYLRGLQILWLHKDERHDEAEAESLRQCGAKVLFVCSLEIALERLATSPAGTYDLVISHMGLTGEAFQLLERMPKSQDKKAFIVYTRRVDDAVFIAEASKKGISYYTGTPWDLFRYVLSAAKSMPPVSERRPKVEAGQSNGALSGDRALKTL